MDPGFVRYANTTPLQEYQLKQKIINLENGLRLTNHQLIDVKVEGQNIKEKYQADMKRILQLNQKLIDSSQITCQKQEVTNDVFDENVQLKSIIKILSKNCCYFSTIEDQMIDRNKQLRFEFKLISAEQQTQIEALQDKIHVLTSFIIKNSQIEHIQWVCQTQLATINNLRKQHEIIKEKLNSLEQENNTLKTKQQKMEIIHSQDHIEEIHQKSTLNQG